MTPSSTLPLTLLPSHHTTNMSENDQPMSDAEKMRLKRLARLGTPSIAPAPVEPTDSLPSPSSRIQAPSAASRLLNPNLHQQYAPSDTASEAGPSTKAARVPQAPLPSISPSPRHLGKRSSASSPARQLEVKAPPATRPTLTPLLTPYLDWEAQRVQDIFSVTLSVSP